MEVSNVIDISKIYNILGNSLDYLINDYKTSININSTKEHTSLPFYIIDNSKATNIPNVFALDDNIIDIPVIVDSLTNMQNIFYKDKDFTINNGNLIILNDNLKDLDVKYCPLSITSFNLLYEKFGKKYIRKDYKNLIPNFKDLILYMNKIEIYGFTEDYVNKDLGFIEITSKYDRGIQDFTIPEIIYDETTPSYISRNSNVLNEINNIFKNNILPIKYGLVNSNLDFDVELIQDINLFLNLRSPINSKIHFYSEYVVDNTYLDVNTITSIKANGNIDVDTSYLHQEGTSAVLSIPRQDSIHKLNSLDFYNNNNLALSIVFNNVWMVGESNQVVIING